jgi:hypothetical protein
MSQPANPTLGQAIPTDLVTEVVEAIVARMTPFGQLIPAVAAVVALGESAIQILQTGICSPEQEAAIRAELDAEKQAIDDAT